MFGFVNSILGLDPKTGILSSAYVLITFLVYVRVLPGGAVKVFGMSKIYSEYKNKGFCDVEKMFGSTRTRFTQGKILFFDRL